jgi:hypothetical protein
MEQVLALERAKDPTRRNIPLVVRMKLDLSGANIHLTDWRAISENDRQVLIDTTVVGPDGGEHFFKVLSQVLESADREVIPPSVPATPDSTLWLNEAEPLEIAAFRQEARVQANWTDLPRFERYLLCHAARKEDHALLRTIASDTNSLAVSDS